jgi:3-phenylpropionate/trans-cinnamate dioxygenase ferredoxin reductase subunit
VPCRIVACSDKLTYPADLVVVGIGVTPCTQLAEACGIPCDNGIIVDGVGRTADRRIYAAGDCTSYAHPFAGRRVRLESVQNAADQGRTVAAMIAGHEKPYETIPWFCSDLYDLKLQMVGLQAGCNQVLVRGDIETNKFSLFHYRGGVLRAIDSVRRLADRIQGRKLLAAGISPSPDQAKDPSFKLKDLLS